MILMIMNTTSTMRVMMMKIIMMRKMRMMTVARVLPLACANEHLLRTMDSLVAVQ